MKSLVPLTGTICDCHEALADKTRRRSRGRAAQHISSALLVMAANVRKIRAFMQDLTATPKEKQRKAQRR